MSGPSARSLGNFNRSTTFCSFYEDNYSYANKCSYRQVLYQGFSWTIQNQISKFLTLQSKTILIHASVYSHLDYRSGLLFGLPKYQLDRLKRVQNTAARVIFQIAKFDHITPAIIDLHWLPISFRVQFKLLLFVYKSLHNPSPLYIKDLLSLKPDANYALRSSAQSLNCSTFGDRACAHAVPVLWNSLPLTIRTSTSISFAIFKRQL